MKDSSDEPPFSSTVTTTESNITQTTLTTTTTSTSISTTTTEFQTVVDDWDRPLSNEELEAIETAFEAATSSLSTTPSFPSTSIKTPRSSSPANDEDTNARPTTRRRLPGSVFCSNGQLGSPSSSGSFALKPCSWNWNVRQGNVKLKYQAMNFGGRIVYGQTVEEVEEATLQILKFLEAKKRDTGSAVLGLDIEWKPSFDRGIPQGKAAVMQICGGMNYCYVLHIFHSGIPSSLQSLLEDPTYVKLLKPKKIRLGNWEVGPLSKAQLQYAATDAFASWFLYEVLKSFADLPENQKAD